MVRSGRSYIRTLPFLLLSMALFFSTAAVGVSNADNICHVDINDPDAYNSIQDAIYACQDGGTIEVAPGEYKENLKIEKSITIKGIGDHKTIIDGQKNNKPVITIGNYPGTEKVVHVALTELTIRNGKSGIGGGILNDGDLTIEGCTISGNSADNGGGIYNRKLQSITGSGTITLIDGTISNNKAIHSGGGIYDNQGTITLNSGDITENTAGDNGGGIYDNQGTINGESSSSIVHDNTPDEVYPLPTERVATGLEKHLWTLESYGTPGNMHKVLSGTKVTAKFQPGKISGSDGCNSYGGDCKIVGKTLSISKIISTKMFCQSPKGIMDQASRYITALENAKSYEIKDKRLEIYWGEREGNLIFVGELDPKNH